MTPLWLPLDPTTDDAESAELILAVVGDCAAPWAWRLIGVPLDLLDVDAVALLIAVAIGGEPT